MGKITLLRKPTKKCTMTILTFSRSRDIASWLIWIIVLLAMLLPQTAFLKVPVIEIWQSADDPVSWLGPSSAYPLVCFLVSSSAMGE